MPIFHDVDDRPPPKFPEVVPLSDDASSLRTSEERARRRVGPTALTLDKSNSLARSGYVSGSTAGEGRPPALNRGELIERIKKGNNGTIGDDHALPQSNARQHSPLPFHPATDSRRTSTEEPEQPREDSCLGLEIERPKSALHTGDFRQDKDLAGYGDSPRPSPQAATRPALWSLSFPALESSVSTFDAHPTVDVPPIRDTRPTRSRATSQSSLSSSFVFKLPTSPLVYHSSSTDLDLVPPPRSTPLSRSPDRRRHTFSPKSLQRFQASSFQEPAPALSRMPSPPRTSGARGLPCQAHQPRRSISSAFNFSNSQASLLHHRRPSFASELSPLHHAPMVGSYEESILRGRMSTTPSRPLNFVAQIGVLGKGQCKANLRCPSHVTVPFPAVFYSYSNGNGRIPDDKPSPYVGLVDLENNLKPADTSSDGRRRRRHVAAASDHEDHGDPLNSHCEECLDPHPKVDHRRREKMKRRSTSPKSPPGGSYRIPQQGQLQIVIKNPNKTAVKLFLVPYDLTDMESGQKTFIRQRSYSAGPIIDMPLSSRTNFGTDRPEASLSNSDDPRDRPMLRYLIHLHICCPSKGRYFLYKSIRVVFANRVPDGKEKLRNEIQLPEPRYSAYKPGRDIHLGATAALHSTGSALNPDRASRRRSAGMSFAQSRYDQLDGIGLYPSTATTRSHFPDDADYSLPPPIHPIPFNLFRLPPLESRPTSREQMDLDSPLRTRPLTNSEARSPRSNSPASPAASLADSLMNSQASSCGSYDKLSKGDVGYGGNAFSAAGGGAVPGPGLLAKRLRSLGVQKQDGEGDGVL